MATAQSTDVFTDHTHGTPIPGTPTPRPCPFCGTLEQVSVLDRSDEEHFAKDGIGCFQVLCDRCGVEGPYGDTALEAATRWNARGEGDSDLTHAVGLLMGAQTLARQVIEEGTSADAPAIIALGQSIRLMCGRVGMVLDRHTQAYGAPSSRDDEAWLNGD